MWTNDKSLKLSILSVKLFFVVGIVFAFAGVPIAKMYLTYIQRREALLTLLITGYICLLIAFFIFTSLYKLLCNIQQEQVFCDENITYLRKLSWLCFMVALITCIASIGFPSFLLVAIVFAFIALILRVVKNVMAQATLIKQENDFTI